MDITTSESDMDLSDSDPLTSQEFGLHGQNKFAEVKSSGLGRMIKVGSDRTMESMIKQWINRKQSKGQKFKSGISNNTMNPIPQDEILTVDAKRLALPGQVTAFDLGFVGFYP